MLQLSHLYTVHPVTQAQRRSLRDGEDGVDRIVLEGDTVIVSSRAGGFVIPVTNVAWAVPYPPARELVPVVESAAVAPRPRGRPPKPKAEAV